MYISLLNYLKEKNQLDTPLWFNKILESYGIDLIVVTGEFQRLGYLTIKYQEYKDVTSLANDEFSKIHTGRKDQCISVIAVDKKTEKILGFVGLEELDDYICMNDLASISNSPSLNKETKIPLIGSILMTAATLLCIGRGKNKSLKWLAIPAACEFYNNFIEYGVGVKDPIYDYSTVVIRDVSDIIPPKRYYEKYFSELRHTDFYNPMAVIKPLILVSRRKKILDNLGGEKVIISKYVEVKLIDENFDIKNSDAWLLRNAIIMQKQDNSLVAYWGEKKEFSLALPIEEAGEVKNIFELLQENQEKQQEEKLLTRIILAYGCDFIGNNYDREYRNKKAALDGLIMNIANNKKRRLQEDDSKNDDKQEDIVISRASLSLSGE